MLKNLFVRAGIPAALGFAAMSAHAELPAGVTTSISGAGTDVALALGAMIAVGASIWGLSLVKRKVGG